MKTKLVLLPLVVFIACAWGPCATVQTGNDSVLVHAQQTTALAKATFDLIEKTEYDTYPAVRSAAPDTAHAIRSFVNNLRANEKKWLTSARTLEDTYEANRTPENAANLNTALAVLQSAINESNNYLAQIKSTTSAP